MKNNELKTDNIILEEQFPLLKDLSLEYQEEIKRISIIKTYPNKSIIFSNNMPLSYLYLIVKGTVHIVKDDKEGKEQIISILRRGEFFPHISLFEDNTPGIAHTTEETMLYLIPINTLRAIAFKCPQLLIGYSKTLSKRIVNLQSRLKDKSFYNTHQQIVRNIIYLANDYGIKLNNEIVKLNISLTHEELAHLVGTTRETVSRSITKLKKINALKTENNQWTLNMKLLEEQASDM